MHTPIKRTIFGWFKILMTDTSFKKSVALVLSNFNYLFPNYFIATSYPKNIPLNTLPKPPSPIFFSTLISDRFIIDDGFIPLICNYAITHYLFKSYLIISLFEYFLTHFSGLFTSISISSELEFY
mmetsp:Transcript_11998/g.1074  ORF Transcript_11998/g.1074 Transcript_11998/m.1074 type:complete len:125 (+) Transcript_11998:617-991(+)